MKESKFGSTHLFLFSKAASELGIKYEIVIPTKVIKYYTGKKELMIYRSAIPINSCVGQRISESKYLTKFILEKNNIPTPKGNIYTNLKDALKFDKIVQKKAIVVKPDIGFGGTGVSIKPTNKKDFIFAFHLAKRYANQILIENFIEGRHYRVLVLDDKVIAVAERYPPYVIGESKHDIKSLIDSYNSKITNNSQKKIEIDDNLIQCLAKQNLNVNSIAVNGKKVLLKDTCNLETGGYTVDKTDLICNKNKEICIKAAKMVNLRYCGIDIIVKDISKPLDESQGVINEINYNPSLKIHHFVSKGEKIDVAKIIMNHIFNI